MGKHEDALRQMFVPPELVGDSTSDVLRENLFVMGKYLDQVDSSAFILLEDMFPDVTTLFLEDYERVYRLPSTGTDAERRAKIVAAHRARGGLSKEYFEDLGNDFGGGNYTVTITEGTSQYTGFIIHEFSPNTIPAGPATLLPGVISEPDEYNNSFYCITVTVTGIAGPDTELEDLFNRLKPAHTKFQYVYVP